MRAPKLDTGLRQEQIVETALNLIGEHGIYALSIAGIAERVGIVPSALYRHFKSKDAVLDAILDLLKNRLMGNVDQADRTGRTALEKLNDILMSHARMLNENRALPLVVFSDGIYTGHAERKARLGQIVMGYLRGIEKIIAEGQDRAEIRKDVIPETASVMFIGMILPAAVLWNLTEGDFDIVEHVENAWPAFLKSIVNVDQKLRVEKNVARAKKAFKNRNRRSA